MRIRVPLQVIVWISTLYFVPFTSASRAGEAGSNWPSFRGTNASGVSEGTPTQQVWDVEKGSGVKWKTATPGLGHSSPVIWGNKLFITTAVSSEGKAPLKVQFQGVCARQASRIARVE